MLKPRALEVRAACVLAWIVGAVGVAAFLGCESQPVTVQSETPGKDANKIAGAPPRAKPRPGAKTVALARAGDRPFDKTFDDLRFEMTIGEQFQRSMLTAEVEALNGQRIRIRGYILPTPQKHGIKQFVLVRDNQECCFGPGAALYDCILVEMKAGSTADFTIRPIAVEGTFGVHEVVLDGRHLAIYRMEGESAR